MRSFVFEKGIVHEARWQMAFFAASESGGAPPHSTTQAKMAIGIAVTFWSAAVFCRFECRRRTQTVRLLLDGLRYAVQYNEMRPLSNFVTLNPYFKVHPGKLEAFKAAFPAFIQKTMDEEKNLFYGFTMNGDEVFCREGYTDAEGVLKHLDNVGAMLAEALKIGDLIRLELHGPAGELDKLRKPLAHLMPAWFVLELERQS